MPDQEDVKIGCIDFVDRQRGAVQRNGSLRRYELGQVCGRAQPEPHGVALGFDREDLRLVVDMTGNEMATEFVADLQ
ncbi:hypothetical protein D3C71_2149190 [compost metagenome]